MKFENTPSGGGDSYEKPKPGKYIGVLVGFSYIGTQPGGQYGPKPKVMLRWELHKRKGPSLDSKEFIHTTTQRFGATVRGENSMLAKALVAHGIPVNEGEETESREWLGRAAWLDLEESDDGKYVNVKTISKLDPEDDQAPKQVLPSEHWDDEDAAKGTKPPQWAAWAIGKSTDLASLGKAKSEANRVPVGAGGGAGGVPGGSDDEDIPF